MDASKEVILIELSCSGKGRWLSERGMLEVWKTMLGNPCERAIPHYDTHKYYDKRLRKNIAYILADL